MDNVEKTIVAWCENGKKTAYDVGGKYEKLGAKITYHGKALEQELKKIGENYDATHLLYFLNEEDIILISFKDEMGGFTVPIKVQDLKFN